MFAFWNGARRSVGVYLLSSLMVLTALHFQLTLADEPPAAWGRFRGPNGGGIVEHCNYALPWQESDVAWKVDLPGRGNGSPVVHGRQIFIMSADPDSAQRFLLSYDLATGNEIWKKSFDSTPHHLHERSSYASSTPCVNEHAVYFAWGAPDGVLLKAFQHDGQEIWSRNLGSFVSQHGFGASPALYGGKLILVNSQQAEQLPPGQPPGESRVTAFDPLTGEVLWETVRTATKACYGVPAHYQALDGRNVLVFANTGEGLYALDLETGEPLWNNRVFGKRCVSSPVTVAGLAIGTEGSGGGGNILWAVDLEGEHAVKFKITRSAPYVPTPVAKDDLLFLWGDNGIVSCVELPGGDVVWSKRIGGNVSTSPVIAGDKLVGIAEDGTLTVLAASREFKNLGSLELGETTRATPLVAEDYMLVRTNSRLLCIGKPQ